jgi:hypothetical protein
VPEPPVTAVGSPASRLPLLFVSRKTVCPDSAVSPASKVPLPFASV